MSDSHSPRDHRDHRAERAMAPGPTLLQLQLQTLRDFEAQLPSPSSDSESLSLTLAQALSQTQAPPAAPIADAARAPLAHAAARASAAVRSELALAAAQALPPLRSLCAAANDADALAATIAAIDAATAELDIAPLLDRLIADWIDAVLVPLVSQKTSDLLDIVHARTEAAVASHLHLAIARAQESLAAIHDSHPVAPTDVAATDTSDNLKDSGPPKDSLEVKQDGSQPPAQITQRTTTPQPKEANVAPSAHSISNQSSPARPATPQKSVSKDVLNLKPEPSGSAGPKEIPAETADAFTPVPATSSSVHPQSAKEHPPTAPAGHHPDRRKSAFGGIRSILSHLTKGRPKPNRSNNDRRGDAQAAHTAEDAAATDDDADHTHKPVDGASHGTDLHEHDSHSAQAEMSRNETQRTITTAESSKGSHQQQQQHPDPDHQKDQDPQHLPTNPVPRGEELLRRSLLQTNGDDAGDESGDASTRPQTGSHDLPLPQHDAHTAPPSDQQEIRAKKPVPSNAMAALASVMRSGGVGATSGLRKSFIELDPPASGAAVASNDIEPVADDDKQQQPSPPSPSSPPVPAPRPRPSITEPSPARRSVTSAADEGRPSSMVSELSLAATDAHHDTIAPVPRPRPPVPALRPHSEVLNSAGGSLPLLASSNTAPFTHSTDSKPVHAASTDILTSNAHAADVAPLPPVRSRPSNTAGARPASMPITDLPPVTPPRPKSMFTEDPSRAPVSEPTPSSGDTVQTPSMPPPKKIPGAFASNHGALGQLAAAMTSRPVSMRPAFPRASNHESPSHDAGVSSNGDGRHGHAHGHALHASESSHGGDGAGLLRQAQENMANKTSPGRDGSGGHGRDTSLALSIDSNTGIDGVHASSAGVSSAVSAGGASSAVSAGASSISSHGSGSASHLASSPPKHFRGTYNNSTSSSHTTNPLTFKRKENSISGDDKALEKRALDWLNNHLVTKNITITNLYTSFTDGLNLVYALEHRTGENIGRYTKKPVLAVHRTDNLAVALNFLAKRGVSTGFLTPQDLIDGNRGKVLSLFSHLLKVYP